MTSLGDGPGPVDAVSGDEGTGPSSAQREADTDRRVERTSRRVARNAGLLIAQPLLLNVISIAVTAYIIRSLGPSDFGRLTYANAMKDLFASLAGLGLGAVTVRDLAGGVGEPDRYVGRMMLLRLVAGVGAYGALLAAVHLGGLLPEAPWAVLLAGTAILPMLLTISIEDVFRAREEMQHIARVRLLAGGLLTAAQVAALIMGGRLLAMVAIFAASAWVTLFLAAGVLVRRFFRPRVGFDLAFARRVLGQGLVFYSGGLLVRVSQSIDKLVLERMRGAQAVGVFSAGTTLLEKLIVLPEGIGSAVYPALSGLADHDHAASQRVLSRFVTLAIIVGLPTAAGGALLAGPLVDLLAGQDYPGAVSVLSVAIWTLPAWCLNHVFLFALSARHLERQGIKVTALATGLLVAGNLVLVPSLGPAGSAAALAGSQWVAVLLLGWLCHRAYGRVVRVRELPRVALGLALMIAGVLLSRELFVFVPVLVGVALYGLVVGPAAWRLLRATRRSAR